MTTLLAWLINGDRFHQDQGRFSLEARRSLPTRARLRRLDRRSRKDRGRRGPERETPASNAGCLEAWDEVGAL